MSYHPYDLGSALMSGVVPSDASPTPPAPQPSTGWTTPSITYDNMRMVNASAIALDLDIQAHVQRPEFKKAWGEWLTAWKAFFEKHQGIRQRLGDLFNSDDIARLTEAYRQSLARWYDAYAAEPDVPRATSVPPNSFEKPPEDKGGFTIPWWAWALGGAALVGAGFMIYRQMKVLDKKREVLENNVLPMVMSAQLGPQLGPAMSQAATAHDPGPQTVHLHLR